MSPDPTAALLHPTSPETRFAAMAELRRTRPIARIMGPDGPFYLASRSAVTRALPAIDRFGGAVGAADVPEDEQAFNGLLEPRHGQIRRLVNGMIGPHKSRRARPFVAGLCEELLDGLCAAAREGPVDAMHGYVDVVPASAIAWLLGWPVEDARQTYRWTVEICERAMDMRPGTGNSSKDLHPEFAAYVEGRIEERRRLPEADWPDDGLTRFLAGEIDGRRLSAAFVRTNMQFLLGAGAETTRDMIGGLLYHLARDPGLYERARADRGLIPQLIEEALRVFSPTQFMVRRCVAPIEIDGQPFEPGDQVFIGLASANRDETLFDDPDRFDPDRPNAAEHVSFGGGPHVCPGASLARMEATIAVGAFLDRFERAETVSDAFEPLPTPMFYGPSRLPVRLVPA